MRIEQVLCELITEATLLGTCSYFVFECFPRHREVGLCCADV